MVINGNEIQQKKHKIFNCNICDYNASKKYNFIEHCLTSKHIKLLEMVTNGNEIAGFAGKPANNFECSCGKIYKYKSGLSRHHRICVQKPEEQINSTFTPKMFCELLKQNNELTKQIIEMSSKPITNNTNNNSFNLNFFLNETCKDALNISDFVNQLQVGIKDLEETGRLGYAEGISKIFINGLKQLDVNQRPVHCSDSKRETMYIKDENQWTNENTILTDAIRSVAH